MSVQQFGASSMEISLFGVVLLRYQSCLGLTKAKMNRFFGLGISVSVGNHLHIIFNQIVWNLIL